MERSEQADRATIEDKPRNAIIKERVLQRSGNEDSFGRKVCGVKEGELEKTYSKLVEIYHKARMGGEELDVALEKVLLGL